MYWRLSIGIALLAFQLLMIGYARFVPSRYFCWAPYDMQTDYELDVAVNGRKLSPPEIRRRYRRPQKGSDNRSVQHLIDILQGYEERYGHGDRTAIVMRYCINGKELREWRWPVQR